MKDAPAIYSALVDLILKDRIAISAIPTSRGINAMYCPKGVNGKNGNPVILVPRPITASFWLDPLSPLAKEKNPAVFLAGMVEAEDELEIVAHEYGHSFSTFPDYEQLKALYDANKTSLTPQERQSLYDEEVFAWGRGREILDGIGYTDWPRFDAIQGDRLKGYRDGLGLSN